MSPKTNKNNSSVDLITVKKLQGNIQAMKRMSLIRVNPFDMPNHSMILKNNTSVKIDEF